MKRILSVLLLTLIPLSPLKSVFDSSTAEGEAIDDIKYTNFAKNPKKCSVLSYSRVNDAALMGDVDLIFSEDDFKKWENACAEGAKRWIFNDQSKDLKDEYNKCSALSGAFISALKLIHNAKYQANSNMAGIRKALEPVISAAKKMNGSFLKKIGNKFSKETPGKKIINTIKEILNKRVKEVIDDFNDKLSLLKLKDVKKLSL